MTVEPTRTFIDYGESLTWQPPEGTAEFHVWAKRTDLDAAMRWKRVAGFDVQTRQPITVPEATGNIHVPGPELNMTWADLLMTFDGYDNEILQVTAHDGDMALISIDRFTLPAPTATNAATIAAQERRVLADLLKMRAGLATMHGGHLRVRDPSGTEVERMPIATIDRRVAEVRARVAWFEAAAAGNVMPGLEAW